MPVPTKSCSTVDEVDIHLNPKIGLDWMLQGQQKQAVTPGQNQKRYLAGALDARTGQLTWVEGPRKTSLGRVKLHFLPPYCPKHNRIEWVWEDLEAIRKARLPCSSCT
jgi:transposase